MSGRRRRINPDDPRRMQAPPPVGEALGDLVRRRGWARRLEGAKVHEHWEEIAGAQIAGHVRPLRLHGGVLVLEADSAVWATQVRYLAADLLRRAGDVLGEGQVASVTVVTGRPQRPGSDPPADRESWR